MSGVSKRCDGTSGELTLVSKRSEDGGRGVALPRSMSEAVGIAIYGFFFVYTYVSRSHFSLLSNQLPWKNQVLHIVQMKMSNPTTGEDEKQDQGEVLFCSK